jgi:hypothetical protein
MKKLFILLVLGFGAQILMAQGDFELRARNKAEAAARACLGEIGLRPNLHLSSAATVNLICDYFSPNPQYFGYQVEVWAAPNCPPNQPCVQVIYPIATVMVDCQGHVYDVQCNTPIVLPN